MLQESTSIYSISQLSNKECTKNIDNNDIDLIANNSPNLSKFNDEIKTLRHIDSIIGPNGDKSVISSDSCKTLVESVNDQPYLELVSVQNDIMPRWSQVDSNERASIMQIFIRWQGIISTNFDRIKSNQKYLKQLVIDEQKYAKKGKFSYDLYRNQMKKHQIGLFKILCGERLASSGQKCFSIPDSSIQPNTRLIMRAFKKLLNAIDCLEQAQLTTSLYWSHLVKFNQHMSKAILRTAIFVYENAKLYKCSLGSPPLYVLESDCCDEPDVPYVKFDTLYEYVYLCLSQVDFPNKLDRRKNGINLDETSETQNQTTTTTKNKSKYYCLILKCLIRLIQLSTVIRDSLIIKQIQYSTDTYAHYLSHECELLFEYLKEIYKTKSS